MEKTEIKIETLRGHADPVGEKGAKGFPTKPATWQDIQKVILIYEELVPETAWDRIEFDKKYPTQQAFFEEILHRYYEETKYE